MSQKSSEDYISHCFHFLVHIMQEIESIVCFLERLTCIYVAAAVSEKKWILNGRVRLDRTHNSYLPL